MNYTAEELKIIQEGEKSRALLNDPFFRRRVSDWETHTINDWKTSKTVQERETLWLKLQLMKELLTELALPQLTKHQLEQDQQNLGEYNNGN